MLLNKKNLLAVLLTTLSVVCTACTTTTEEPADTADNTNNGNVAVDNAILPEINDEMAPTDEEKININIGLIKNSPEALGSVYLFINSDDNSAYEKYTPAVYNTAEELSAAFNAGEIYAAVVPADKAALCYFESNCYVTAITTNCNYYIAENGQSVNDIPDLNGKTITVSAEDTMAQSILNIIADYNEISVSYNVVNTNNDLINGLKDGTISLALTQEPYLSQAAANDNLRSALDLYDYWNDAVDTDLATSCLIVNKNFVSENAIAFQFFMRDYSSAASLARRNAEVTAQSAGEYALIDDVAASKSAIPGCGIIFKTNDDMKSTLTSLYNVIAENNIDILGGHIPGDDFYFIQDN